MQALGLSLIPALLFPAIVVVVVAIPADGFGEVTCTAKAQTTRRMARSKAHTAIAEGEMVRIQQMQGDVALVEPLAD